MSTVTVQRLEDSRRKEGGGHQRGLVGALLRAELLLSTHKKCIVVLVVVSVLALNFTMEVFASAGVWQDIGRGNTDVKTVLVNPDDSGVIYIGSDRGVFKSGDSGETWRNILSVRGQRGIINLLWFDPLDKNSLYAATGNGLYYSGNQGEDWKRIFRGKNSLENECSALLILPESIYLGTKAGLFVSINKGRTWHRQTGKLGKGHILAIAHNIKEPGYIYVASPEGIFKTVDNGIWWEKIFLAQASEESANAIEEKIDERDEVEKASSINYLTVDPSNLNCLYVATTRGIYQSQDKGLSWQAISGFGLLSKDIKFILASPQGYLYAATRTSIFEYKNDRWQEISFGLVASEINYLTVDRGDNLYAACDKGLFKVKIDHSFADNKTDIISIYCKDEPAISQVQEAAIRYAEVQPEKIALWRKQAAKRAILPKVTIGMDRDIDRTTSSSIWGTAGSNSTAGKHYVGPDDITRYNNKNWGVSLTWELADLIWNDDQTNIDVRSRLMVQLRGDILDEVNKIYFERIRVKMELNNLSIEDRKKRFEKELRLQELTASLDALTGGYFSSRTR